MTNDQNSAAAYILALARRIAAPYVAHTHARAVMVVGSSAPVSRQRAHVENIRMLGPLW